MPGNKRKCISNSEGKKGCAEGEEQPIIILDVLVMYLVEKCVAAVALTLCRGFNPS